MANMKIRKKANAIRDFIVLSVQAANFVQFVFGLAVCFKYKLNPLYLYTKN